MLRVNHEFENNHSLDPDTIAYIKKEREKQNKTERKQKENRRKKENKRKREENREITKLK